MRLGGIETAQESGADFEIEGAKASLALPDWLRLGKEEV